MKKPSFLNLIAFSFALVLTSISSAGTKSLYCGPESSYPEFCNRMTHLKATINTLDSQTWFDSVNYSFLENLATGLIDNSLALNAQLPEELKEHRSGLKQVLFLARELKSQAIAKKEIARETAGYMKYQCLSCHSSTNPTPGGLPWNDVFGFNWSETAKNCEKNHADPYLCKSMNAMATDYSHIDTAFIVGIQNYEVTSAIAQEILRVLEGLKVKALKHLPESYSEQVKTDAQEVIQLANRKDPLAFQKALGLNQSCMKCHMQ